MHNCLTVDVEEWFHVCGAGGPLAPERWPSLPSRVERTTRDLLDLFDGCGVRATFFVVGWVAERHPHVVAAIRDAGHEIGSHSHLHRRVYELTPDEFADDLDRSVRALQAAGAGPIAGFRAPEWSINDRSLWALDVLAARGFRYDSSMAPLKIIGNPSYPQTPHARYTSSGALMEFPPLVDRWLGQQVPLGGSWGLRMSDPDRVLRVIGRWNRAGTPVTLFVHPWEIDDDPPRAALPWGQRFAHYFRLAGFRDRLARVLCGASFGPTAEALGRLAPAS
jgi:polysaccharide deacetylase family protein (PEP-CTERM system associated)